MHGTQNIKRKYIYLFISNQKDNSLLANVIIIQITLRYHVLL